MDEKEENEEKCTEVVDSDVRDVRKRTRGQILSKIKHQMEFYFSDANLQKDRFLSDLVKKYENGFVDLKEFQYFNRIRALTSDVDDIVKALHSSKILEVSEDGKGVRRKVSFVPQDEKTFDDRTIYVERLPPHANHTFIKNVFNRFGAVAYISIPKFKNTSKIKGFAFVEFEDVESAQKAHEFYKTQQNEETEDQKKSENVAPEGKSSHGKKKRKRSSDSQSKDSPQKIARKRRRSESEKTPEKAFRRVSDASDGKGSAEKDNKGHRHEKSLARKRKRQSSESEKTGKKTKLSVPDDESRPRQERKEVKDASDEEKSAAVTKAEAEQPIDEQSKDALGVKRLHESEEEAEGVKKHDIAKPETSMHSEKCEKTGEEEESKAGAASDSSAKEPEEKKRKRKKPEGKLKLRVMTKEEWRKARNRYFTVQKKVMRRIKKMLLLDQQQRSECDAMLAYGMPEESQESADSASAAALDEKSQGAAETEYQPNAIIKLTLEKPPVSYKALIVDIKSLGDVAYVDTSDEKDIFVRFKNAEAATECLEKGQIAELGTYEQLTGDTEKAYWEKIRNFRQMRLQSKREKKRGRDKILAKAAKLMEQHNTHIYFDE